MSNPADRSKVILTGADAAKIESLRNDLAGLGLHNVQASQASDLIQAIDNTPDCDMIVHVGGDIEASRTAQTHLVNVRPWPLPLLVNIGSPTDVAKAVATGWFDFCVQEPMSVHRCYSRITGLLASRAEQMKWSRLSERHPETDKPGYRSDKKEPTAPITAVRCLQLVYVSRSLFGTGSPNEVNNLSHLGNQARQFNRSKGITGSLIHREGFFVQILEGATDDVFALMTKIERDVRHKDVVIRQAKTVEQRLFGDWSMACFDIAKREPVDEKRPFMPYEIPSDLLISAQHRLVSYGMRHAADMPSDNQREIDGIALTQF